MLSSRHRLDSRNRSRSTVEIPVLYRTSLGVVDFPNLGRLILGVLLAVARRGSTFLTRLVSWVCFDFPLDVALRLDRLAGCVEGGVIFAFENVFMVLCHQVFGLPNPLHLVRR